MQIVPYIHFNGQCAEALEYYRKTLGAQVEAVLRFRDAPVQCDSIKPEMMDKVMHSSFRLGDSQINASDCGQQTIQSFSLTLLLNSADEVDRTFNLLADGGKVLQPTSETFFSKRFGVVQDRFGVSWILIVPQEQHASSKRESEALASA